LQQVAEKDKLRPAQARNLIVLVGLPLLWSIPSLLVLTGQWQVVGNRIASGHISEGVGRLPEGTLGLRLIRNQVFGKMYLAKEVACAKALR
jgi:hypothetical protein